MDKINRVGEQNRANNGQMMTIIEYRNYNDIDIMFDDNTIVKHIYYNNFKNGYVKNPNNIILAPQQKIKSKINKTNIANNGLLMTIITYRNCKDIDVQFEDGVIVKHKSYGNFIKGKIKHPNIDTTISKNKNSHIGESIKASNGQIMTIIDWIRCNNVTVKFEDGTVVNNVQYSSFIQGRVKNPNKLFVFDTVINRLGETITNNSGQKMCIIAYRSCVDIDVQFEDGVIVTNKTYRSFIQGEIRNPNKYVNVNNQKAYNKWINYTKYNNNGIKMTIIDYKSDKMATIQFETGYIVNTAMPSFRHNSLKHPFPYILNDVSIDKPAYIYKNVGNFYCTCNKCGKKDIMTIEEIKQHKCIKGDYHNGIK